MAIGFLFVSSYESNCTSMLQHHNMVLMLLHIPISWKIHAHTNVRNSRDMIGTFLFVSINWKLFEILYSYICYRYNKLFIPSNYLIGVIHVREHVPMYSCLEKRVCAAGKVQLYWSQTLKPPIRIFCIFFFNIYYYI